MRIATFDEPLIGAPPDRGIVLGRPESDHVEGFAHCDPAALDEAPAPLGVAVPAERSDAHQERSTGVRRVTPSGLEEGRGPALGRGTVAS